eukprot:CAMPEP_0114591228 /NCGR_PEP_ID=MMETSP0125-20121206/13326_1 /TAXON_ID=485358 ORGANISM="Aristerostoma sp., Strain ATCC 50986" /NCGR_SAMPLE_ID=MMETSP0125 /ASSEMBLY_ACC=CAM_ASM_000245 /LENGTH=110 /DNA_ID=CAMNT_0001789205 /DNA_START=275 /DNA_END=607 /DNA_ORIENTATION=+
MKLMKRKKKKKIFLEEVKKKNTFIQKKILMLIVAHALKQDAEDIHHVFSKIDSDKNGKVDIDELANNYAFTFDLGHDDSESWAHADFDQIDKDGNGFKTANDEYCGVIDD